MLAGIALENVARAREAVMVYQHILDAFSVEEHPEVMNTVLELCVTAFLRIASASLSEGRCDDVMSEAQGGVCDTCLQVMGS